MSLYKDARRFGGMSHDCFGGMTAWRCGCLPAAVHPCGLRIWHQNAARPTRCVVTEPNARSVWRRAGRGRTPRPLASQWASCSTGRTATARTACAGGLVIKCGAFFGLADADRHGSSVCAFGMRASEGSLHPRSVMRASLPRRAGRTTRRWKRTDEILSFCSTTFLCSTSFLSLDYPPQRSATLALSRETTD